MEVMNAEIGKMMAGSPPHQAYMSANPTPDNWPMLVDKLGQMLRKDYDWSEGVASIKAPTLIVVADADALRLEHILEMYRLVGGVPAIMSVIGAMNEHAPSQLAMLPGATHYDLLEHADLLLPIVTPFLDAPVRKDN
jgi:pimeloyl-ACP methyl ester carboxylesterase